jgi:hypothetical protein
MSDLLSTLLECLEQGENLVQAIILTHEGSTVVVCLNSLRLLFVREPDQRGA